MKRIVSLLVVVSVVSTLACAGAEDEVGSGQAESGGLTPQEQLQRSASSSDTRSEVCIPPEIPAAPTASEPMDLDNWDFNGTPLLPLTTTTQSLYLVAFQSPVDRQRLYVYGIDVVSQQFIFSGTLAKRFVGSLTQRVAIDISSYQLSGSSDPHSGIAIQIDLPPPPPPQPNIHDPSVQNFGKLAWEVAVKTDGAVKQLHY